MTDKIQQIIKQHNVMSHENQGILVVNVKNQEQGFQLAKESVYAVTDTKTVLYLSGGRTPKNLYGKLAREEQLEAGAVGLIDERYGAPQHENSNEKMLQDSGILRYLQMRDIKFYAVLKSDNREVTAEKYDQVVRELHNVYQKSVGILGIGLDGHTAGIAGNRIDFQNPLFDESRKHLLVSEFNDEKGMYKERVTMTFLGLSMLDLLIVLVFGDDKKEAMELMFQDGPEEEIPSRFFKRPEIAAKTLLISDQGGLILH